MRGSRAPGKVVCSRCRRFAYARIDGTESTVSPGFVFKYLDVERWTCLYILCRAAYTGCTAMAFLSKNERRFLAAVSQLAYSNPFVPERTGFERAALGDDFVAGERVWSLDVQDP